MITGLWGTPVGERFSFDGAHYQLTDSPALPKPHQRPGPPVIVGGGGKRRTPALAARFASEFNLAFSSLADTGEQFGRVRQACRAAGRQEDSMVLSAAQVICCGEDEATITRRAGAIGREVAELRVNGLCGTPAEAVAKLASYADVGVQRMYLQVLDLADLDHLALIAEAVLPYCAAL